MRLRPPSFRRLQFESLETRRLLAGDVTVKVAGGTLLINGNDLSNNVAVTAGPVAGSYVVTGTSTTINGKATPVQVTGVKYDIVVNLKKGDDQFTFSASAPKSLIVNGDAGNDTVTVNGDAVGGDIVVDLGAGNDVYSQTVATVNGCVHVIAGQGSDDVTIHGPTGGRSNFNHCLVVDLGTDNDRLDIANVNVRFDTTVIGGGGGSGFGGIETLSISQLNARSLVVDAGSSNHVVALDALSIAQSLVVTSPKGPATIIITGASAKDTTVALGQDAHTLVINGLTTRTLTVAPGRGPATLDLKNLTVTKHGQIFIKAIDTFIPNGVGDGSQFLVFI